MWYLTRCYFILYKLSMRPTNFNIPFYHIFSLIQNFLKQLWRKNFIIVICSWWFCCILNANCLYTDSKYFIVVTIITLKIIFYMPRKCINFSNYYIPLNFFTSTIATPSTTQKQNTTTIAHITILWYFSILQLSSDAIYSSICINTNK